MLWATIDPIGTLAVFASMTRYMTPKQRFRTAAKALLYAGVILVGAIVVGQIILSGMGIKLVSLQVAGGIILFLFGLKMIFDEDFGDTSSDTEPGHDIAVFPLAVPSIASPGAIMAVIILTDNNLYPIEVQAGTTLVLIAILVICFGLLLAAGPIVQLIGHNGAGILVRVMGMILAALSVELVFEALNLFEILGLSKP